MFSKFNSDEKNFISKIDEVNKLINNDIAEVESIFQKILDLQENMYQDRQVKKAQVDALRQSFPEQQWHLRKQFSFVKDFVSEINLGTFNNVDNQRHAQVVLQKLKRSMDKAQHLITESLPCEILDIGISGGEKDLAVMETFDNLVLDNNNLLKDKDKDKDKDMDNNLLEEDNNFEDDPATITEIGNTRYSRMRSLIFKEEEMLNNNNQVLSAFLPERLFADKDKSDLAVRINFTYNLQNESVDLNQPFCEMLKDNNIVSCRKFRQAMKSVLSFYTGKITYNPSSDKKSEIRFVKLFEQNTYANILNLSTYSYRFFLNNCVSMTELFYKHLWKVNETSCFSIWDYYLRATIAILSYIGAEIPKMLETHFLTSFDVTYHKFFYNALERPESIKLNLEKQYLHYVKNSKEDEDDFLCFQDLTEAFEKMTSSLSNDLGLLGSMLFQCNELGGFCRDGDWLSEFIYIDPNNYPCRLKCVCEVSRDNRNEHCRYEQSMTKGTFVQPTPHKNVYQLIINKDPKKYKFVNNTSYQFQTSDLRSLLDHMDVEVSDRIGFRELRKLYVNQGLLLLMNNQQTQFCDYIAFAKNNCHTCRKSNLSCRYQIILTTNPGTSPLWTMAQSHG
eukprot:Pgem_evm2s2